MSKRRRKGPDLSTQALQNDPELLQRMQQEQMQEGLGMMGQRLNTAFRSMERLNNQLDEKEMENEQLRNIVQQQAGTIQTLTTYVAEVDADFVECIEVLENDKDLLGERGLALLDRLKDAMEEDPEDEPVLAAVPDEPVEPEPASAAE